MNSNQDPNHYPDQVEQLLVDYLKGDLSEEERHILAEWLSHDAERRKLLASLKSADRLAEILEQREQIDPENEYLLLEERFSALHRRLLKRKLFMRYGVAAAIILAFVGLWSYSVHKIHNEENNGEKAGKRVLAVLTTAAGEDYLFDGKDTCIFRNGDKGPEFVNVSDELVCKASYRGDSSAMHELAVPRGGEYRLRLSDGTLVCLNAESNVRFPSSFAENHRDIELTGEVYLEVARDTNRPFRVKAGPATVEVLGTSFCMNVYPDQYKWSAALVEGSVKVCCGQDELFLKPGMKAMLEEGRLVERRVDVEKELAWLDGRFIFQHDVLEEVTQRLTRWYDVRFVYEDEKLKKEVFTGTVSKDMGIDCILSLIQRLNVVRFEKRMNYILIKGKEENTGNPVNKSLPRT